MLFINIEFHLTSLCEAAFAIANSLPKSLARQHDSALAKAVHPPKGGSSAQGPVAATAPLSDTWEGQQFMAFSGDFEQV